MDHVMPYVTFLNGHKEPHAMSTKSASTQSNKKSSKKGKGKKKKGYTVEYDPEKDESIVRYKHKKDGDWDEDW